MWYFAWVLGLGFACAFGILNAMWYEMHAESQTSADKRAKPGKRIKAAKTTKAAKKAAPPGSTAKVNTAKISVPSKRTVKAKAAKISAPSKSTAKLKTKTKSATPIKAIRSPKVKEAKKAIKQGSLKPPGKKQ